MIVSMIMPSFEDVSAAHSRLAGHVVRTPLVRLDLLDAITGAQVWLKLENMQVTGSFKYRGAFNRLSLISPSDRGAGVVACSSGNHAQGVAEAARRLGMRATIVMPSDAPALKVARTRRSGAEIVLYDRVNEDREAIARAISDQTGAVFAHPFDDPQIVAGQGTVGVELVEDMPDGMAPDLVFAPASGGGLASGVALALSSLAPNCRLVACEPTGFDDMTRSLALGQRVSNAAMSGSICDALLAPSPGQIGFSILQQTGATGHSVSDAQVLEAMAFAFHELKQVIEPGGAAALATVLSGQVDVRGKCVGIVVSGGNVDPDMLAQALKQAVG